MRQYDGTVGVIGDNLINLGIALARAERRS